MMKQVFFKDFAKVLVISYNAIEEFTKNCFEERLFIIEQLSIIGFFKTLIVKNKFSFA